MDRISKKQFREYAEIVLGAIAVTLVSFLVLLLVAVIEG